MPQVSTHLAYGQGSTVIIMMVGGLYMCIICTVIVKNVMVKVFKHNS